MKIEDVKTYADLEAFNAESHHILDEKIEEKFRWFLNYTNKFLIEKKLECPKNEALISQLESIRQALKE